MVVVGVLLVTLRMEGNSSLKEKRRVVKSLLGRVKARFNASASEVGGQDRHETAVVGFSVMGSDARVLNRVLDHILNFVDDVVDAEVVDSETICPLYADEAYEQAMGMEGPPFQPTATNDGRQPGTEGAERIDQNEPSPTRQNE
ncbi:MAG: DUF503 domain-containing protein [Deltaproteobacteria bacterium]|jgi:uncharacterized protein YlxP (DUF503 family)|nr:DUF503 domain-containing protein [Deltaproteobacteria bacterium]